MTEKESKREKVDFDWLHVSEDDNEPYEVFDYEVKNSNIYGHDEFKMERGTAPRYYDALKIEPKLQSLLDNFSAIRDEISKLVESNDWTPWPEHNLYSGVEQEGDWRVIPLLYTFPATDDSSMKWVDSNMKLCPLTCKLLKAIPGVRTALFSRMGCNTRLSAHQGWADLANYVLRVHLPLVVPEEKSNCCGMWVEGWINYHKEKQLIMFDDSKWHKAFNQTNKERIVLIFDILRPKTIPKGKASSGHTDKLDEFIKAFEKLG